MDSKESKTKSIIDEVRIEIYKQPTIMKLIGSILIDLKKEIVPVCNHDAIKHMICKGNSARNLTAHQVCHGASAYIVQYYLKEGYNLESAKQLGCTMWNKVNRCSYFPVWKTKLFIVKSKPEEDDTVHDINLRLLEKMCRIHHKKANLSAIKDLEYKSGPTKWRPTTYWMCFDKAISKLPNNNKKVLKQSDVEACLHEWNEENGIDLFSLST